MWYLGSRIAQVVRESKTSSVKTCSTGKYGDPSFEIFEYCTMINLIPCLIRTWVGEGHINPTIGVVQELISRESFRQSGGYHQAVNEIFKMAATHE